MKEDAYGAAGVHIDAGIDAVKRYQSLLEKYPDPRVLRGIGGFSGCFSFAGFRDPVLVASTDGVGTKVVIAAQLGRYDGIGADLVNHCINDILCANAQPLFFLDYLAVGALDSNVAASIVEGIARACSDQQVALLGGETAEMPGVYTPPQFDLAGTIVGAMERREMLDPVSIVAGDQVVGLPSNGLHTNGYSLARKILPAPRWADTLDGGMSIGDALLRVHPCYLETVQCIKKTGVQIKGMAHITGGGLIDNLARAVPEHLAVRLDRSRWKTPPILELIVREGKLTAHEANRVFNMGVGFCCIVGASDADRAARAASDALRRHPIRGAVSEPAVIGEIQKACAGSPRVIVDGA
jgi:phosphoribosylformylglycinamidine cyclo-ligase